MNIVVVEKEEVLRSKICDNLVTKYPGCTVFCYALIEQALSHIAKDRIELILLGDELSEDDNNELLYYLEEQKLVVRVERIHIINRECGI